MSNSPIPYDEIDRELEKQVFLTDASEGNYGLYSLVWELGHYSALSIGEKYTLANDLLKELVLDGLLVVKEYEDSELNTKLRTVAHEDLDIVLGNPRAWYPREKPVFATDITDKGNEFMSMRDNETVKMLMKRLFGMEKPWG